LEQVGFLHGALQLLYIHIVGVDDFDDYFFLVDLVFRQVHHSEGPLAQQLDLRILLQNVRRHRPPLFLL
jgi:hypothetical protein